MDDQELKLTPWLIAGSIVLGIGAVIFIRAYGIADSKIFGVAQENANREVYEQTKAYRDGVQRDLDELVLAYNAAKTPAEKASVASILRHRSEGVPPELVPAAVKEILGR